MTRRKLCVILYGDPRNNQRGNVMKLKRRGENDIAEMYRTMKWLKVTYYFSLDYNCYILEVHVWRVHIRFLHWWNMT